MLIRFVVNNVFSFGEQREFNTIPNKFLKTIEHHKYNIKDFQVLKLSSIYGANGAGKSNMIKSLLLLQTLVLRSDLPHQLKNTEFKFNKDNKKKQVLAIEFFEDDIPFYYGIEFLDGLILTEELYISGLGKKKDELIYERKTNPERETSITFSKDFEKDEKSQLLKAVLLEEFVKPEETILRLVSRRDNPFLQHCKKAYNWFDSTLEIISPTAKPKGLAQRIDTDEEFKNYASELMCSFNIGISGLIPIKVEISDFFGKDNVSEYEKFIKKLEDTPSKTIALLTRDNKEIVISKEGDQYYTKMLSLKHTTKNDLSAYFDLEEESDGTVRLLDFIPAFKAILTKRKVYVIDEIERSIHPLLIKELIRKFSMDDLTRGQLIFTTHESNLLDQEIFRQDEIWFAEKNLNGATDLYSLSDFKEHKTIDIRKGYLNGRYGSIPFLGNLRDLNWQSNDINE